MAEILDETILRADGVGDTAVEPLGITAHLVRRLVARAWWVACLLPAAVLLAVAASGR